MSELTNNDPMPLGKIIDESANFIFKNILWITFIGFIISLLRLSFEWWMPSTELSSLFGILKHTLTFNLIDMILPPFLAGTVTILLGEQLLGRNIPWYQGVQKSIKKWIPLVLLQLLVDIVAGVGTILLIIPGIIAMCATACVIPAMMLEDLGPMKAFERSWNLTKNNRFRIFGYSCLVAMLTIVFVGGIPLVVTMGIPMDPIYKVGLSTIILAPLQALWPAMATLLFFDLRTRKEAMDLEEETNTSSVAPDER